MNDFLQMVKTSPYFKNLDNSVIFITIASLVAWGLWRFIYARLVSISEKTSTYWDDLALRALKTPISTLIWCWPATISIGMILEEHDDSHFDWIPTLKPLMLIAIVIWVLVRLVTEIEHQCLQNRRYDETTVQAVAKVARLFFVTIGLLSFMQAFGLSLSGLLTFGGVGGLIVGLAAKDLLSNFFGGMMIYFDRPFKVGEWIRSPEREIEGTVERIGGRMTVIRTFDKRPLYVPNSVFSNIVVETPSRMLNRRIYETIGLRYQDSDKIPTIIDQVKEMLQEHDEIDSNQTMIVNFDSFGPSSLNFFVYTFTKTVNWNRYHEVKQDVLLKVIDIIHDNEADIAFPTRTLMMHNAVQPEPEPEEQQSQESESSYDDN
ncbi:MAG: mechanosensitive ion channel family protein [Vibrio sp.]